jgi:microcystin degradation protein MlrC
VQERLVPAMQDSEAVVGTCAFLGKMAGLCGVPVMVTEQYPKGLGPTVMEVLSACAKPTIVEKTAFSAAQEKKVIDKLRTKRSEARAAIRSSCAAWRRMSACCNRA